MQRLVGSNACNMRAVYRWLISLDSSGDGFTPEGIRHRVALNRVSCHCWPQIQLSQTLLLSAKNFDHSALH